jgi:hypothetical protein
MFNGLLSLDIKFPPYDPTLCKLLPTPSPAVITLLFELIADPNVYPLVELTEPVPPMLLLPPTPPDGLLLFNM